MCIKSSCTKCHSKSHCQEKELKDEIEEYKKLTDKLIKELEDSNKFLELAGEKIEKMKTCDNCKHNWKEYGGENSCELTWTKKRYCTRKLNFSNNFEDFWELG